MEKQVIRTHLLSVLEDMKEKAIEMNMHGVAVAALLDADSDVDWIAEMKVVGAAYDEGEGEDSGWNFLAIAWSKAAEIIASGENSGNPNRKLMHGELGFVGGAYGEHQGCKLAFAFSGGTSEEDLIVSQYGIEKLKALF